jgi:hypothetical protein
MNNGHARLYFVHLSMNKAYSIGTYRSISLLEILLGLVEYRQSGSKHMTKICKRSKTEYEDTGYPVCDHCLRLLDNWE